MSERIQGGVHAPRRHDSAVRHVTGEAHPEGYRYQPTNVVFALFPPLEGRMKKAEKRVQYSARAVKDFDAWAPTAPHPVSPMQRTELQRVVA